MVHDGTLAVPSPVSAACCKVATDFLNWSEQEENLTAGCVYAQTLVSNLRIAFSPPHNTFLPAQTQAGRERMWALYHNIRTSMQFRSLWTILLEQVIKTEALPIFYQTVTEKVFHKLIHLYFPITPSSTCTRPRPDLEVDTLTYEEENVIRYIAGFVYRSVKKKISMMSAKFRKEELLMALSELLDQDDDDDEDDTACIIPTSSKDWINIVNRGGLVYVNDKANSVFHAIEYEVRRYLRVSDIKSISSGIRAQIIKAIIESENVQSQWCSLATDMTEEAAQDILKMIAETWITIRGFSFAKSFVEL